MADKNISIWDKSIYGLVFNGRDVDPKAPVRHIDATDKIVVFTLPNRRGGMKTF